MNRRRVALAVLLLSLAGTLLLHLRLERRDHSWLLRVDGVPHDVLGAATEAWHRARRDCAAVEGLRPGNPGWDAVLAAVAAYSPPDSLSVRLVGVLASGEWRVAEARFERLAPVVVALREQGGQMQAVEQAVWSGSTWPWEPGPLIRRWLRERAPGLPPALLACFDTSREAWSPRTIDGPR